MEGKDGGEDGREQEVDERVETVCSKEDIETEKVKIEGNNEGTIDKKQNGDKRTESVLQSQETQTEATDVETVAELKKQLETLMNSLATLSAEKSKMEANFQLDRKQLRGERDECEKVIKDLKDRLRKAQSHNYSEIEHVKCKLIMERHEREKEQMDHAKMIQELQKLLYDERQHREQLEAQLKTQFANKTQCKILEAELEITRNKLKQAEEAAKETPPILLNLQAEMAIMKKQHLNAIHEEQKRAAAAEQQARALAMTHEARVAGLEARLAELSEIVGGYDRLRQQDQQAIQKLKEQLSSLQEAEHECPSASNAPEEIVARMRTLYTRLLDVDNKKSESAYVKSLLNSLGLCDKQENADYREKYESLLQELEEFKQQYKHGPGNVHEKSNSKTQLHLLKAHNSNLEERIRVLNNEMAKKEAELQMKLERQYKSHQEDRAKLEHTLLQKDNEYRSKISTLEQQLLRQRERSMALVEEKDKEILTLKASFHAFIPRRDSGASLEQKQEAPRYESASEPAADLVTGLLTSDSPPILHYTQELARKEVQVSASRKRVLELEAALREKQREILHARERQKEETGTLQAYITRLEACKSREGANLEYLKNVLLNYLTTSDASSKRHMLNAISTVLRFTPDELNKIRH